MPVASCMHPLSTQQAVTLTSLVPSGSYPGIHLRMHVSDAVRTLCTVVGTVCTRHVCDKWSMSSQEFCEDCPDQSKTVRRDATFKDNSALPAQVALRTGDYIYDGLRNGFRVNDV